MKPWVRWSLVGLVVAAAGAWGWTVARAQPPAPWHATHVRLEHHTRPGRARGPLRVVFRPPVPAPWAARLRRGFAVVLTAAPAPSDGVAPAAAVVENAAGDLWVSGPTLQAARMQRPRLHGTVLASATVLAGINGRYPLPAVGMPRGTPYLAAADPDVATVTGTLAGQGFRSVWALTTPTHWVLVTWVWTAPPAGGGPR